MSESRVNASGRTWSSGPYVRKGERLLWDCFYAQFADELKELRQHPESASLTDQQIDTAAYNCAYRAVWELRHPSWTGLHGQ